MAELKPLAGRRQPRESDKAVIACNDYLRMGAMRSIRKLLGQYCQQSANNPPTIRFRTLAAWSSKYNWQERASAYDAAWDERKTEERNRVMGKGLALDYERVKRLMRLADFIEGQLYQQSEKGDYHNVWLPDVKQIGSGPEAERVDIERFNAAIISEYRSALDDLAKETGGRIKKQEIAGKDGGDIVLRWGNEANEND